MSRPTREEVAKAIYDAYSRGSQNDISWACLDESSKRGVLAEADWHLAELDKETEACAEAAATEVYLGVTHKRIRDAVLARKQPPAPKWCEHITWEGADRGWFYHSGLPVRKQAKCCDQCGQTRPKEKP